MSNLYFKKQDVLRSLYDYLEDKKTIGECIDAVPAIDLDDVVRLIEQGEKDKALLILKEDKHG